MVGYITTAHDIAQRLSEKWRHFVVHCLYSLFCTSPRCVGVLALRCLGVPNPKRHRHLLAAPTLAAASTHFLALLLLALPFFARATLRLARRCRSFSSFSSSRTRSCVARQEGPLVPPTLPWQVELSEGPPPAPPLLRTEAPAS